MCFLPALAHCTELFCCLDGVTLQDFPNIRQEDPHPVDFFLPFHTIPLTRNLGVQQLLFHTFLR